MIQPILIGIALLASFFGLAKAPAPIWDNPGLNIGSTNFPTSLDSLTNPGATDSVATVSHSAQHANANDAIEALEAKLGIGASTAVNNTIFVGDGTGSSSFSTSATSTNFLSTNLTSASTTLGSTSVQTLLAKNSTTTNLFVSNIASTTDLRANVASIGNLSGTSANLGALTVSSCSGCSSGGTTLYAATTSAYKAKTLNLAAGDLVLFGVSSEMDGNSNFGTLGYRISSAAWGGPMATTTGFCADDSVADGSPTSCQWAFLATSTATVTFDFTVGSAANTYAMWVLVQSSAYGNQF